MEDTELAQLGVEFEHWVDEDWVDVLGRRIRQYKSYTEYLKKVSKPSKVLAYREGFQDGFETVLKILEKHMR